MLLLLFLSNLHVEAVQNYSNADQIYYQHAKQIRRLCSNQIACLSLLHAKILNEHYYLGYRCVDGPCFDWKSLCLNDDLNDGRKTRKKLD